MSDCEAVRSCRSIDPILEANLVGKRSTIVPFKGKHGSVAPGTIVLAVKRPTGNVRIGSMSSVGCAWTTGGHQSIPTVGDPDHEHRCDRSDTDRRGDGHIGPIVIILPALLGPKARQLSAPMRTSQEGLSRERAAQCSHPSSCSLASLVVLHFGQVNSDRKPSLSCFETHRVANKPARAAGAMRLLGQPNLGG